MKILLILAPVINRELLPMGPAYLKSYIMHNSPHTVKIINLNENVDINTDDDFTFWGLKENTDKFLSQNRRLINDWMDEIMDFIPDIIGFSCWYSTKWISLHIAEEIKKRNPHLLTVFGGIDCSFRWGDYIENSQVDVVVKGEGEETFLNIVRNFERKKDFIGIKGTVIKIGKIITDYGLPREINDIDSIPFPDYSDLSVGKEFPIAFVRGCRNSCSYCHFSKHIKRYRARSAGSILEEIKQLKKKFPGIEMFYQGDAGKLQDIGLVEEFCNIVIDEGLKIAWNDWSSINPDVTFSPLKKMRKAGCQHICWGVESGSQKILDRMRKKISVDDAERLIRDTDSTGILAGVNFIVGFPGESEEDFNKTLQFIHRNRKYIKGDFSAHKCLILPMSHLHRFPEKYGIRILASNSGSDWEDIQGANSISAREEKMQRISSITGHFRFKQEFLDILKHDYSYDDIKGFLQALEQAKKKTPDVGELYLYSGILFCNTGRYEPAVMDLNKAEELGVDTFNLHRASAHACIKTLRYEEALRHLDISTGIDPGDPGSYIEYLTLYAEWGKNTKAFEYLQLLIDKFNYSSPMLDYLAGTLYFNMGDFPKSIKCLQSALESGYSQPDIDEKIRICNRKLNT